MERKLEKVGALYKAIGHEIAGIVGDPAGVFLYVEAGDGWVGTSLYKDEGTQVRWYDPTHMLTQLLTEVWEAEEPSKRWSAMEYSVTGTKFQVDLVVPEDFRDDLDIDARRELVLRTHFGDKPRVYPPPGQHGWTLSK